MNANRHTLGAQSLLCRSNAMKMIGQREGDGMNDIGTVGKYTLRRMLGKGAMGVVYEAFDPMIERTVALKTIRKDLWEADDGDELRERFLREARAAGRLLHPGIVTVYEFGESDGGAFIVMEHVSGRTLKEMIDEGKCFSVPEVVALMVPVLSALSYSHRAGVIHRDIKPANLMVTDEGQVKILDFGVARLASASITQVGTILGTPAYMAPEQLMGQTVDARADLYSAGVILRELLCGQKTFSGDYGQVLRQVLYEEPARPSVVNPAVPAAFDIIVARAMAREPDQRFASAEAFIEALYHPASVRGPASASSKIGRSSAVAAALAVLLLAGGGGAAYQFGLFGGHAPPSEPAAPPASVVVQPEPAKPQPTVEAAKAEPVTEPPKVESRKVEPVMVAVVEPPKVEAPPEPAKIEPVAEPPKSAPVAEAPEPALTPSEVVAMLAKPAVEPPPAPKPRPATLTVVTDRGSAGRYKVGETMQVLISSDRQTEVYCFYQSASGEIVRVFPTRFSPHATLKAKQLLKLPGSQPFSFQFDRKHSREEVRCLGLDSSMAGKLPKLLRGSGFEPLPVSSLDALVETIRGAAGEEVSVGKVVVTVE